MVKSNPNSTELSGDNAEKRAASDRAASHTGSGSPKKKNQTDGRSRTPVVYLRTARVDRPAGDGEWVSLTRAWSPVVVFVIHLWQMVGVALAGTARDDARASGKVMKRGHANARHPAGRLVISDQSAPCVTSSDSGLVNYKVVLLIN
jgi:hypothetical protein